MEGQLKKRGAKMPVMHDRYCVATWETDQAHNKYVLLRSFKSRKHFDSTPGKPPKPLSACTLKCFGDWDGKGKFRRYQHAFLMETREGQVFLCAAPSEDEKSKWLAFMSNAAPVTLQVPANDDASASASDLKQQVPSSEGTGLRLNKRLSMRFMTQALESQASQASDVQTSRASDEHDINVDDSDDSDYDSDVRSTTDDELSLDEHLGLCDCAKAAEKPELERECSDSSSLHHDDEDDVDTERVEHELPASIADALEVLDARPSTARPAHEASLSDLVDGDEVLTPDNCVESVAAPSSKASTVAPAQVAVAATSAPTTQASSLSIPFITRTRSAESNAAPPASTVDAAAMPAIEPTTQQAIAPRPLPTTKSDAELAAIEMVPAAPVQADAKAAGDASHTPLRNSEATADEAAPLPVILSVAPSRPDMSAVERLFAPTHTVVKPKPLKPTSPLVTTTSTTAVKPEAPKPTSPPTTTTTTAVKTETVKPTTTPVATTPAPVATAPTAPVAASAPAVVVVHTVASTVNTASAAAVAAVPSTPTLPLAEEAGGSLSLPPVIAVHAVGTLPSEPSTPTARSHRPLHEREARTTPPELGTGHSSSNDNVDATNDIDDDDDNVAGSQRISTSSTSSSDASPSPRRTRGRANSSVMPQSFESSFATPTRLRRYSFSSTLAAPVRSKHAFALGSPLKQSFLEPHLGYVRSGLSTMVPSFPGLLTTLSRQHSVDEREEFSDELDGDDRSIDIDEVLQRLASTADIDEV